MKNIKIKNWMLGVLAIGLAILVGLNSCKKTIYPIIVDTTQNISDYFDSNPDKFSLFDQILNKTGYSGFLGAYGAYTVFAPNNDAVTLYLKGLGKASVDQVDVNVLKDMVKLHVIQDTLSTANFTDGKLPSPTLYGQFLTTGATNVNGVSSYTVNKQAIILNTNLRFGNGIVHIIDHVLMPATLTLAQSIAQNPKYSMFAWALKATGFYDTLNVAASANTNPNRKYFTLLAQTDSVFRANGIADTTALLNKYSFSKRPFHNTTDSLYLFVAYHILAENSYLNDIISKGSHNTLASGEIISDVLQVQTILINNDTFNGVLEPGIALDRANSDITTTNGVLHSALGNIHIKVRSPARVDWDLGDQPEFRKQTTIFRRAGQFTINYGNGQLVDITMNNGGLVNYSVEASTTANFYWWDDHLNFVNFRNTAGQFSDCTLRTPVIVKGKYKVWFAYRNGTENSGAQFFFDGVPLQNVIPIWTAGLPSGSSGDSDPVLESKGYKRYTQGPSTLTVQCAILLGVVNVTTTDRHILEMVAINGGNQGTVTADLVQFIPIDQDQEYPRFRRDGTLIPRP